MTTYSHTAATLSRLLAVDWSGDASFDHARSRAKLFKEYLRRAALWADAFAMTGQWPFFDVAAVLTPEVQVPGNLAAQLETVIATSIGWPSVATICRASLRWATVRDAGMDIPNRLPDPYEPLLLLFERGGGFTTEHGFADLGGASIPLKAWQDHLAIQPVVSLDAATLAELDAG